MSQKKVLLVEDEQLQREALHRGLENRGFSVASAADPATARRLVEQQKAPFDVLVLDMELHDPSGTTGADLGIEFLKKREWQDWPAEFLICSAYGDKKYYARAMKLGAAAYLEKGRDSDLHSVVRHVRALALRRALSVDRPEAQAIVASIARSSLTKEEAVRRFCREVLYSELFKSLGCPFIMLVTDSTGTHGYTNQALLPDGPHKAYETVQALTQGATGTSDLFVFDPDRLDKPASREEAFVFDHLCSAVFIQLMGEKDLRLSVGLFPEAKRTLGDDPKALASVLAAFLRPTVLEHLLTLSNKWTELYVHRLAVLTATSQLCLYVGQEQLTLLEEAAATGEIVEVGSSLKELQLLAEDLREAGEILGELAPRETARTDVNQPARPTPVKSLVSMGKVVQSAWGQTSRMLDLGAKDVFRLDGDCKVQGRREYLEIATSRVFQWFIQRLQVATPPGPGPSIVVTCRETAEGMEVVFEDRSRKLSQRLREYLFLPFSQAVHLPLNKTDLGGPGLHLPLYMAKALVELGNGGLLEDRTPVEGEFGNRLVMRFPAPSTTGVSTSVN
jgi:DNA-binding NarL/FixJ family response regulator